MSNFDRSSWVASTDPAIKSGTAMFYRLNVPVCFELQSFKDYQELCALLTYRYSLGVEVGVDRCVRALGEVEDTP